MSDKIPEPTPGDRALDLAAAYAACEEATPGPWTPQRDHLGHWRVVWPHSQNSSVLRGQKVFSDEDIAFIALARSATPALCRLLAEARAEVGEYNRLASAVRNAADADAERQAVRELIDHQLGCGWLSMPVSIQQQLMERVEALATERDAALRGAAALSRRVAEVEAELEAAHRRLEEADY